MPVAPAPSTAPDSLPELLRIMDVATALRQEREKAAAHLNIDQVRAALRQRLRATADAMGDTVSDAEIEAAITRYFGQLHEYEDPPPSLQRTLAHLYVRRNLVAGTLVVLAFLAGSSWWILFSSSSPWTPAARAARAAERRAAHEARADEQLGRLLKQAAEAHRAVLALAKEDETRQEADSLQQQAVAARAAGDGAAIQRARTRLDALHAELAEEYELRVLNRPGELSGVFRNFDRRLSGYYLLVEAVAPDGTILRRQVRDAEDGDKPKAVRMWGEQVPKAVYDRIAADKTSDGIVDENVFARKRRGYRRLDMVIRDAGGAAPLARGRQIADP